MSNGPDPHRIANSIRDAADDPLRDVHIRGKHCDVFIPVTALRRLEAVLESTKQAVLDTEADSYSGGLVDQMVATERGSAEHHLDGFSHGVQHSLRHFKFHDRIPHPANTDLLGSLIESLTSPDANLSLEPATGRDRRVVHPGLRASRSPAVREGRTWREQGDPNARLD